MSGWRACIDHYGCSCQLCGFNFEKTWGELGKDFIHVHHLKEISSIREEYEVDPVDDLIPVCPNCHAMLHRRRPALAFEEIRPLRVTLIGEPDHRTWSGKTNENEVAS